MSLQGFLELGKGEAFDTFPNMFPDEQFLKAAEIKHGRQAMLAWTGVWATSTVRRLSMLTSLTPRIVSHFVWHPWIESPPYTHTQQ